MNLREQAVVHGKDWDKEKRKRKLSNCISISKIF